ncbi:hypothetical protein V2A60_009069 [Cordyceps javanica]|uniref:Uncharacterized protein n=1 Tax=Cordyceps javanica TaxID=43265 RepID=A0A545USZ6_9HYPO|nr:hypothetical protein IF1G_08521 [Cordyceps javanica]TQW03438.1 hypothetical protein IF2G_09167 [Cordyceps javanica]
MSPPSVGIHDRRFITIVKPPPAPGTDAAETSTPEQTTRKPSQQSSGNAVQRPQPTTSPQLLPGSGQRPGLAPAQPPTQLPTVTSAPTSRSREAQQPPVRSDAPRNGAEVQTSSSIATRSGTTSIASFPGSSQRPEKQPDSAPMPVSSPKGLSRGAEVGIVIGSIAVVALLLGAAMFYYYKRKPSRNNIFTSRNKNLVPQRAISRPFPIDMSSANQTRQPSSRTPRPPPVAPVLAMTERPLPPLPLRQSVMGRSSSSYSRLP